MADSPTHLFLHEARAPADSGSHKRNELIPLTPIAFPSFLLDGRDGAGAFFESVDPASRDAAESNPSSRVDPFVVVDLATSPSGASVVIFVPPGISARINGLPARPVTPLAMGDQLSLGQASVFHLSRRSQASALPTPAAFVGKPCPICLVQLEADTHVISCSNCSTPRHFQGDEVAVAEDRLLCAELGACPVCDTPRPSDSNSLAFVPEGFTVKEPA